jgi:transcription initiation factor TFIIIB Brf1 subunit/transcription initiation factor TFIIB
MCKSSTFILENHMNVCAKCSTVADVGGSIDTGAEWRNFDDCTGKDPTRCGMPANWLAPKCAMSTFVGFGSGKYRLDTLRVSRSQLWTSVQYKERTLLSVTDYVGSVAAAHGIPESIVSDAKRMLKDVMESGVARGDNRKGLHACSVYFACMLNNVPRSVKEISEMFGVSDKVLTRSCKRFQASIPGLRLPTVGCADYVRRFCSELGTPDLSDRCVEVAQEIDNLDSMAVGASPVTLVSGIILHVCGGVVDHVCVARVCGVSVATMKKACRQIVAMLKK